MTLSPCVLRLKAISVVRVGFLPLTPVSIYPSPLAYRVLYIGQWRYTEPDPHTGEVVSSIYRSIVINTSRDTMNMSDFPMDPNKYPLYPVSEQVIALIGL